MRCVPLHLAGVAVLLLATSVDGRQPSLDQAKPAAKPAAAAAKPAPLAYPYPAYPRPMPCAWIYPAPGWCVPVAAPLLFPWGMPPYWSQPIVPMGADPGFYGATEVPDGVPIDTSAQPVTTVPPGAVTTPDNALPPGAISTPADMNDVSGNGGDLGPRNSMYQGLLRRFR
jgi:hypothetical protein